MGNGRFSVREVWSIARDVEGSIFFGSRDGLLLLFFRFLVEDLDLLVRHIVVRTVHGAAFQVGVGVVGHFHRLAAEHLTRIEVALRQFDQMRQDLVYVVDVLEFARHGRLKRRRKQVRKGLNDKRHFAREPITGLPHAFGFFAGREHFDGKFGRLLVDCENVGDDAVARFVGQEPFGERGGSIFCCHVCWNLLVKKSGLGANGRCFLGCRHLRDGCGPIVRGKVMALLRWFFTKQIEKIFINGELSDICYFDGVGGDTD